MFGNNNHIPYISIRQVNKLLKGVDSCSAPMVNSLNELSNSNSSLITHVLKSYFFLMIKKNYKKMIEFTKSANIPQLWFNEASIEEDLLIESNRAVYGSVDELSEKDLPLLQNFQEALNLCQLSYLIQHNSLTWIPKEVDYKIIMSSSLNKLPLCPSFSILHSTKNDDYVILIRGIYNRPTALYDLFVTLLAFPVSYRPYNNLDDDSSDEFVHCGIWAASIMIYSIISRNEQVLDILKNAKNIRIIGHSLGGAVSTILKRVIEDDGIIKANIVSYAVGCPPIVNEAYRSTCKDTHVLIHLQDPVAKMSMATARSIFSVKYSTKRTHKSKRMKLRTFNKSFFKIPSSADPETAKLLNKLLNVIQSQSETTHNMNLEIPGTISCLFKGEIRYISHSLARTPVTPLNLAIHHGIDEFSRQVSAVIITKTIMNDSKW